MKSTKVKFENNWKSKSLESLEKDIWAEPAHDSHLIRTCNLLRKKPISDFATEDLRIMISQNIGLKFLIPLALETLTDNILAEGDLYEGDLLNAVLTSDKYFWKGEKELIKELTSLISINEKIIKEQEPKLLKLFNEWKMKL